MKEQRITIKIDHEGRITADADGFTGDACIKDLERLLDGLAPGAPNLKRKPEDGSVRQASTRTQDLGKKP
jgi:hypothetical protein